MAQAADPVCSAVMKHCLDGWPERHAIELALKPYWKVQGELSVHNNLLLFQKRIVVPGSLQQETLEKLHHGHQDYPWQSVAMDLFMLNGANYVLIVDYFSRHGIPETVRSNNGPQFSSDEFARFAADYGFWHTTSSPKVMFLLRERSKLFHSRQKFEPPPIGGNQLLSGKARRNRHELNIMPCLDGKTLEPPGPELEQALPESQLEQPQQEGERLPGKGNDNSPPPCRIMTRSQTGTMIHPPERLGW
eukprot:Em0007g742a